MAEAGGGVDGDLRADVVVVGGTAAGVVAAVQTARLGARVVLVVPEPALGGMTTSGLGATDVGHAGAVGGIARELYRAVRDHYRDRDAWRWQRPEQYGSEGFDPDDDVMFAFEPHVATRLLERMLAAVPVPVLRGVAVTGARVRDRRLQAVELADGTTVRGERFLDCTYEGDLLALAGVDHRVGRESADELGETAAGNQWRAMREDPALWPHDFARAVDAYRVPGDPASGLLTGVDAAPRGEVGQGDARVQAYCFRLCLTDVPANLVPVARPDDYRPERYELLLRHLLSRRPWPGEREPRHLEHPVLGDNLAGGRPWVMMPNRKTDSNTKGAVSFDLVGGSDEYPTASLRRRAEIVEEHRSWQQGLIWFVGHDPRVPEPVRAATLRWGLAGDEFTEHGNWPPQLYVREARRMRGADVVTQHVCLGVTTAADPVGLGAYTVDSHHVRRYVDEHGLVRNEGTIGLRPPAPYGIGYDCLTPRRDDCENLLVPVCLSATHVAFGSVRMEPVFMVLAQSAAAAAVHSIEEGCAVQDVDRPRLLRRLRDLGQVLTAPAPEAQPVAAG